MKDKIKQAIKADLYRYGGETSIRKGLATQGFRYIYFLRLASKYRKWSPLGMFYRMLVRRYKYKYGFQIPVDTQIGEGFFLGHFGTVVINVDTKIGRNCNMAHTVTIGQANRGALKGCPTIGDRVWIGTGSVIVGKITIGSNVLVAPNTFVNMDVPDNSIVVGSPPKIIDREDATEGYINNILGE